MNIILKYIFKISLVLLIIISLYPGSLIGYFFYGDLEKQPNLISNPFDESINHFIYYFYVSFLGLILYAKNKNFKKIVYTLFFLSVILEFIHIAIPKRSFQFYDLFANILGVLVAYFAVKIYLLFNKNE